MMKSIVLKISVLLITIVLFFTSCINSENELEGYGDAYILVEVIDGDTLMALGFRAFSYTPFRSVVAHHVDDEETTYTLAPYLGLYNFDYVFSPRKDDYTKEMPLKGEYVFDAVFTGDKALSFKDELYQSTVIPPKITTCEFVSGTVEVEWNRLSNADAYNVKMWDQDGNIIFVSARFNSYVSTYSFTTTTDGWQQTTKPATGAEVTVSVEAFLFEPGSSSDFQCISISKHSFIWGQ